MNDQPSGQIQYIDLSSDELVKHALNNKEGVLAANKGLTVKTGKRTGRSPNDRFIVKEPLVDEFIDWGPRNQPISKTVFDNLWQKANAFLANKPIYIGHYGVGAHPDHTVPVTVTTQYAWHQLFVHDLFIREPAKNANAGWTMLNAAEMTLTPATDGVNSEAALIFNFSERKILLCGLKYGGEMKKAMFGVLNYLMPAKDILPMHCAANANEEGEVALFFGLSGTGKTTLSADPERYLIGDDEHGWSRSGVFNFEGGCYAKCIHLSREREPVIWNAICQGAVMENVVLDAEGMPNYHDTHHTENTRTAYPREHIPLRILENRGGLPRAVIFLTCDLYGVLPPVALLTKEQAAY